MCGVIGVISIDKSFRAETLKGVINDCLIDMKYRGPDSKGLLGGDSFLFGHVRLSILDLNSRSDQPYRKDSDNVLVYNGEIYNYKDLIQEYDLPTNEGNSDTEVLYNLLSKDTSLISKLNGMFAFCFFDSQSNKFHIVRDKYGIKPLYVYRDAEKVIFSSESKLIRKIIDDYPVNKEALAEWSYFGNTLGENTFYKNIKRVLPGCHLTVDIGKSSVYSEQYFRPIEVKRTSGTAKLELELESLIEKAVNRQLCSDVDVGVFLSGGIDSCAITSIAASTLGSNLKAYTARFDFADNSSDLQLAKKFSKEVGCQHEIIDVGSANLISVIEELVRLHDGPFSDAANIPLYLMAQEVKGDTKVVLQGDGGDELFAGYKRYASLARHSGALNSSLVKSFLRFSGVFAGAIKQKSFARVSRYLLALGSKEQYDLFSSLLTTDYKFLNTLSLLSNSVKPTDINIYNARYKYFSNKVNREFSFVEKMLYIDSQVILPDVFFEKVDRSTMAGSIEVRVPFLDDELVEFASSLPCKVLMGPKMEQKYLIRKVLSRRLPSYIVNAPKKGFSVPYELWLKTSLKQYFLEKVESNSKLGVIDYKKTLTVFHDFCNGKNNGGFVVWKLLQLMIWLDQNPTLDFD